jgi:hydroxypyruvate isomerase
MPRLCANLKWLFSEHRFLERFSAAAHAGFTAADNSAYIGYQFESYEKQLGRDRNRPRRP